MRKEEIVLVVSEHPITVNGWEGVVILTKSVKEARVVLATKTVAAIALVDELGTVAWLQSPSS